MFVHGQTIGYSEPLVYFIVVAVFRALFLKNGCVLDAPKRLKKSSVSRKRHHIESKLVLRDLQKSIFACFVRTKKDRLQHVFEKLCEAKKSQPRVREKAARKFMAPIRRRLEQPFPR
jgi:hypothetical protein